MMVEYATFPTWDEMSRRDQLLSEISDLYKDVNGFRPRRSFDEFSDEQLAEYLTNLGQEANEKFEEDRAYEKEKLAKFRGLISEICDMCNSEPKDAIRYLMDAEGVDELEYLFYRHGLHWVSINEIKEEFGVE